MKMTTSGTEINKNHRGASVNKTAEMTRMALMVAMNCVSAYIIIPLPFSLSPIALQTLIVNLTGYVLNAKQAFMTMLVYLLVGLAGFLFTAVFLAYFRGEKYSFKRYALLGCVIGIPLIYVFGVVQLKLITGMGWDKAIMTGALPFIPLDIVKCLAAAVIAYPINRIFANNR